MPIIGTPVEILASLPPIEDPVYIPGTEPPGVELNQPCDDNCPPKCDRAFHAIRVYPLVVGGTWVEWDLEQQFGDVGPYEFQLQVAESATADDWEDVGPPVSDVYLAVDDNRRLYGMTNWLHYRVKLTTATNVYYSEPQASCFGSLSATQMITYRNGVRVWENQLRRGPGGQPGYLLKRRWRGEACSCLDPITKEIRNSTHLTCFGTGIVGGYYPAQECVYAQFDQRAYREHRDIEMRGSVNDVMVQAKMLAVPQLMDGDIWVSQRDDQRYWIHSVQHLAEVGGVPVAVNATMHPLPASHIIYEKTVP